MPPAGSDAAEAARVVDGTSYPSGRRGNVRPAVGAALPEFVGPNPVNFEAATTTVTESDIREKFAVGPDAEPYERAVQKYADAGFDRLVLQNAGPDPDGFLDFYESRLSVRLRVPA